MKKTILVVFLISGLHILNAQDKYFSRNGHVYFISHTAIIDIDANNYQAGSMIDLKTGDVVFAIPMKAFKFELALAEDHFNEDYVESEKYPKSTFKGTIINLSELNLKSDSIDFMVEGELFLHGVTQKINEKARLIRKEGKLYGICEFKISLADYQIQIPSLVKDKVAPVIPIRIVMDYLPYTAK